MRPQKGDTLVTYVREAGKVNISAERISELMVLIAGCLYFLSDEVSALMNEQMKAEQIMDNALVLEELKLIAENSPISKAHTQCKNADQCVEARTNFIAAKGEYELWRGRLKAAQLLLSSLQMRLSYLTKEKSYANYPQLKN